MVDEHSPSVEKEDIGPPKEEVGTTQMPEDVEALKKALAAETARAEDYLSGWKRAQADFINFKRRTEQEKAEATKFSNAMLILNLLPVLDDLQRAFNSVSASLAGLTWVNGMQLIHRKLEGILEAQGLSQIKALGEKFDPHFHEAVMYKEGDEGVVIEEVQKGYKLHDRVIRPSLVVVGKGAEKPSADEGPKESSSHSEDKH